MLMISAGIVPSYRCELLELAEAAVNAAGWELPTAFSTETCLSSGIFISRPC